MQLPLKNSNRTQNLLTKTALKGVPALYEQDGKGEEAIVHLKFYIGRHTWYLTEIDPETGQAFGLVDIVGEHGPELGYFSLPEIAAARGQIGNGAERDAWWKKQTIAQVREAIERRQAA